MEFKTMKIWWSYLNVHPHLPIMCVRYMLHCLSSHVQYMGNIIIGDYVDICFIFIWHFMCIHYVYVHKL